MPRGKTRPRGSTIRKGGTRKTTTSRGGVRQVTTPRGGNRKVTTSRGSRGSTRQATSRGSQSARFKKQFDDDEEYDDDDDQDTDQDSSATNSCDKTFSTKSHHQDSSEKQNEILIQDDVQNTQDILPASAHQTINQTDTTILPIANQVTDIADDDTISTNGSTSSKNPDDKPKFILRYKPPVTHQEHNDDQEESQNLPQPVPVLNNQIVQKDNSINYATADMLSVLVNEAKILFLRSRDPPQAACNVLLKSIAPGFSETSKTISFLKSKLSSYFSDHRSRLNTEARAYAEDYIKNNSITLNNLPDVEDLASYVDDTVIFECLKNPMGQVTNEWWNDDIDSVDIFRFFIASAIRVHIVNVIKCINDPHLTNVPALNEVKTLNYITYNLYIPHNNSTNYANEIDARLLNSSLNQNRRGRGRGRGRGGGRERVRGHGGDFGKSN